MFKKILSVLGIMTFAVIVFSACSNIVRFDKDSYTVEYGSKVPYNIVNIPEALQTTISVGNKQVLSLANGEITAIGVGESTVTITLDDLTLTTKVIVIPKKLDTPKVTINDHELSWSEIDKAESYTIEIGSETFTQTETTFSLFGYPSGIYNIKISANNEDPNYDTAEPATTVVTLNTINPLIQFETNSDETIGEIYGEVGRALNVVPTRSGYTFLGWYTDADFNNAFSGFIPADNVTLYARWLSGNYDLTIVKNGQSIQDAIDSANAGSTVFVMPGVYVENVTINKSLTLLGNNFDITATDNRRNETIIYPASNKDFNSISGKAIIDISVPNVKVAGIEINGDNPNLINIWTAEKNAVMQALADGTTSSRIEVMALYNSKVGKDIGIDAAIGIKAYRQSTTDPSLENIVIENNIITNFSLAGLNLDNNNHAKAVLSNAETKVTGNIISNVNGYGLLNDEGTVYYGAYGQALLVDSFALDIENNTIKDCTMALQFTWLFIKGQTSTIANNTLINNSVGYWLNTTGFGDGMVIDNNTIIRDENYSSKPGMHSYSLYGIMLSGTEAGSLTISNNTISNYAEGININNTKADSIVAETNTISNCNAAFAMRSNFLSWTSNIAGYITVRNDNILTDNVTDYSIDDNTSNCRMITIVDADDQIIDTIAKGVITAPTVTLSGTNIRFAKILNATGYKLYLNGQEIIDPVLTLTNNYYYYALDFDNEALETYTYQVIATGFGDLQDSSLSKELVLVRVTVNETIFAPAETNNTKTTYFVKDAKVLSTALTANKNGYALEGWYLNGSNETLTDTDLNATISVSGTYYGAWLKISTYTYYDGSTVISTNTFILGEKIVPIDAPYKEGYEFVGWYSDSKFKTAFDTNSTAAGSNGKLYAKYELI